MSELIKKGIAAHLDSLAKKEYSAEELVSAYLAEIAARDGALGALITVDAEGAMRSAKCSDARRAKGESFGALDGIPIIIKDNICTKGLRTTCASRILEDYIPPYDATVCEKLRREGAIILGKANMDEFAMGSTGENSAFRLIRNPIDDTRVAGGSSGGSAAAVGALYAPCALGSDTGGSVRQPAAFCGIVGMKPTYGAVSRYGLVAFASSLEQIGPMTANVKDNAILLDVIAGKDPMDATSVERRCKSFAEDIGKDIKGLRIGLPKELFGGGIAEDVKRAVLRAADIYADMGAELVEISLPSVTHSLAAYYIISSAEASSNLARFDGVRFGYRSGGCEDIDELYRKSRSYGFGAEVKRRVMLGAFALSEGHRDEYYNRALKIRTLVSREIDSAFERCDLMLSPTAPTTARRIGEVREKTTDIYSDDVCCVSANIAGVPALSVPCGKGEDGMPVGMQLVGRAFSEPLLYRVAAAFEKEWGERDE